MLKLITPAVEYVPFFADALRDGLKLNFRAQSPEEISAIENNPEAFIQKTLQPSAEIFTLPNGTQLPNTPRTELWYVDEDNLIGRAGIRYELNEHLHLTMGNIGFSIRPGQRNKGYATRLLKDILDHFRAQTSLDKVLLIAADGNIASHKVIEKNGGVLENICQRPYDDAIIRRYWITL